MIEPNAIVFSLDLKLSKLITNRLAWLGFSVYNFKNFKYFWSDFFAICPDLILVDDSLISKHVFGLLKEMNLISTVPVIFLTQDHANLYQTYFFDITHVLIKPFSIKSLDTKVASILNNNSTYSAASKFKVDTVLSFHLKKRKLDFNKSQVFLTKTEFKILSFVFTQKDQSHKKSIFLKEIWGYDDFWSSKSNILEMHFSKIKKKLKAFFGHPRFLTKIKNNFLFYF